MNQTHRATIIKALMETAELYRQDLTEPAVRTYLKAINEYSPEAIQDALSRHIQTSRFMPQPADLRALIDGPPEIRAEQGFQTALKAAQTIGSYDSVAFEDKAIMYALSAFGGFRGLCMADPEELKWNAKEFVKLYVAYLSVPLGHTPAYYPGINEQTNKLNGYNNIEPVQLVLKGGKGVAILDSPAMLPVHGEGLEPNDTNTLKLSTLIQRSGWDGS
jgi:hypothetical protein